MTLRRTTCGVSARGRVEPFRKVSFWLFIIHKVKLCSVLLLLLRDVSEPNPLRQFIAFVLPSLLRGRWTRAQKLLFDVNKISRREPARRKKTSWRVRESNHTFGFWSHQFFNRVWVFRTGKISLFSENRLSARSMHDGGREKKRQPASGAANMIE